MSRVRGRPRSFDRDRALLQATDLFWTRGYEATSVNDLTRAMGVTPPSLYAAFGSKRKLFAEVVQHYQATAGAGVNDAFFTAATLREGVEAMLRRAATDYTDPAHPPGCLVISAATNCGPESQEVREELRRIRQATIEAMTERAAAAVSTGELPPDTDARGLISFYAAVLQGMSQRAQDGASRAELETVAATALRAWPVPQG